MRILVVTQGSGGDLLPYLALCRALQAVEHEVVLAVPPSLTIATRLAGVRTALYGRESYRPDARQAVPPDLLTLDADGWTSWERTLVHYYEPPFASETSELRSLLQQFRPDVVLVHGLCYSAMAACRLAGIPWVGAHLYPQFLLGDAWAASRAAGPARTPPPDFAEPLRATLAAFDAEHGGGPDGDPVLCWGRSPYANLLWHDGAAAPGLASIPSIPAVGYPYWDGLRYPGTSVDDALAWLAGGRRRIVLTAGSFIGAMSGALWQELERLAWPPDWRVIIIGADAETCLRTRSHPVVRAFGFLPMSVVIADADAVAHHGGIGTSYGCLRAGAPVVIVPRAFDQLDNGRWLAREGTGVVHDRDGAASLVDDIERILDGGYAKAAGTIAERLTDVAAIGQRVLAIIEEARDA